MKKKRKRKQNLQTKKRADVDVIEKKSKFLEEHLKGMSGISAMKTKEGKFEIYCQSVYLYQELKEPFEKYGYTVYCGRKRRK